MRFLERIGKIKFENRESIVLARCGAFVVVIGNDARILSKEFGLRKTCIKKRVCKVGIPLSYTLKYLELIEDKGYSYVLYDYDKNTKELIEKFRYLGINKVEEIDLECPSCESYKEENVIDIFELLKMKEEEKKENEKDENKESESKK